METIAEMYVNASDAAEILCTEVKIAYKFYAPASVMFCWFLEKYCGISFYLSGRRNAAATEDFSECLYKYLYRRASPSMLNRMGSVHLI